MLLMMLFFTLGLVFSAACSNNPRPSEKQEGPESGVYYYDSDEGEYNEALRCGDLFRGGLDGYVQRSQIGTER